MTAHMVKYILRLVRQTALTCLIAFSATAQHTNRSWAADNGNGTYSNPLFYDGFSEPDMIRVGTHYYLTGTTMHTMPGLPILHSRDPAWTIRDGFITGRIFCHYPTVI